MNRAEPVIEEASLERASAEEIAFIKQIGIFSDLSDDQVDRLLGIVTRKTFRQGEAIIKEGETGDTMYILLDGTVEISKSLTMKVGRHAFEQMEKSFIRLEGKHHACFGEMGMLQQDERSATVVAVTDCLVFEVTQDDFDRYCEADPLAGYRIVKKIAQVVSGRLRGVNKDVLKLTTALSLALAR
jgi:CRP-like cAMP-binding protein